MNNLHRTWYRELNRYHWFVLIVAALGWLFDTMDQQLFNLARVPAMRELLAPPDGPAPQALVQEYSGHATAIFLMGWATGGLAFGVLGDRIGRAKTMLYTILIYSLCTGLSALSRGFWDFAFYRFITGLGVGGEFAVGVSLVAEVMPAKARPFALGLLQALSAVGNISAAVISLVLGHLEESGAVGSAWRVMFVVGTLPALLAILIRRRLKEPEQWQKAKQAGELKSKAGSYAELFGHPVWRKNAILGMLLAFAGVVGLWGIGFFSIDLNRYVFRKVFDQEERQAGEAEQDRRFVQLVLSDYEAFTKMKAAPKPDDLLSLTAKNPDETTEKYPDATTLLAAIQSVGSKGQELNVDAVVAAAATAIATQEIKRQGADPKEDAVAAAAAAIADPIKSRWREYLEGAANATGTDGLGGEAKDAGTDSLDDHAKRIGVRNRRTTGRLTRWAAVTSVMLNIGAFFGIYGFSYATHFLGRRPTFAISFLAAMVSTAAVFHYMNDTSQVFWLIPIMGICQLSLFGGYAIYFPELFPTHLRSTGTSFCYNVGRFVAAAGPSVLGLLSSRVFKDYAEPMRPAGITMCSVFVVGLLVLPFLPETRGKALPE